MGSTLGIIRQILRTRLACKLFHRNNLCPLLKKIFSKQLFFKQTLNGITHCLSSLVKGLTWICAGARCSSLGSVLEGISALGNVRSTLAGRSFASEVRFTSRSSLAESTWRIGRAGRATAPVGRVSIVPAEPEVGTGRSGRAGLASRPFKTRERRSSPSSDTPGVRAAAPVGLSCSSEVGFTLAGRAMVTGAVRLPAVVRSFSA